MPHEEFRWDGGRHALHLVATVGKRHFARVERIPDGVSGARWLQLAGLRADATPLDGAELGRLQALREATYRVIRAAISGDSLPSDDVAFLNEVAAQPDIPPRLVLDPHGPRTALVSGGVDAALSTLARDAIALVEPARAGRVKECGGDDCSILFLDTSQAGRRRWCSMERCGNVAKVRSYRAQHAREVTHDTQASSSAR